MRMRDFLDNGNENMRNPLEREGEGRIRFLLSILTEVICVDTADGRGLCIAKEEDDGIGPFVDDQ